MEIIKIPTIGRADKIDGHAALCPSYSPLLNGHHVGWAGKRDEVETSKADRPCPSSLPYPLHDNFTAKAKGRMGKAQRAHHVYPTCCKELRGISAVFKSMKQMAA